MVIRSFSTTPLLAAIILLCSMGACKKYKPLDDGRPRRSLTEYFDKKYLLYQLPADYYKGQNLNQSFQAAPQNNLTNFKPLGYNSNLNLQYTHVYSSQCVYHKNDSTWKYAEVCFPNTCLTKQPVYAEVTITNPTAKPQNYYLRLYYQNTTYWYPTNDSIDQRSEHYLDNYYGCSPVVTVLLQPKQSTVVKLPYQIGMVQRKEFDYDISKNPARPGNYEFMLLALPVKDTVMMDDDLTRKDINPFALVKQDQLNNGGKTYYNYSAYTGPKHFKFVFLDEYFDSTNDLTANHIYIPKNGKEKKLCDTCGGWYRAVINEYWKNSDFFKGFISKQYFVKATYGIKKENTKIDTSGVTLTIPKSRRGEYNKNWGEFLFGPSFKYGHLTVRAKFAQMMNKTGTPNGIIHNLWLYQRDPDPVDTSNPYNYLRNTNGVQPYELDFEIWNSQDGINTMWDDNAFINYSVMDYMRKADVAIKPGELKQFGKYKANRLNKVQCNVPGDNIPRDYFNYFHTYELYWYPDHVRFVVDGYEQAVITNNMASIPNKHLFLWIGSPMYQDGTYYNQSSIPFLVDDKHTIVDYIKIE